VPRLNTHVANLQGTTTSDVCAATTSILTGLGVDGSLSSETASVLIFEEGHQRTHAAQHVVHRKSWGYVEVANLAIGD